MAEEPTTAPEGATAVTEEPKGEQTIPYERFQQANRKAKENAERASKLEKDMAELQTQMQEREQAGLPELERLKKDMERLQKRAEEAEQKATEADTKLARSAKERWITTAAQDQNFADPSDAAAFVDLDEIDDEKDAERAVKRLAVSKKHLLKAEEPKLPGRVLQDGRPASAAAKQPGGIDPNGEAEMLAEGLKQFLKTRRQAA